MAQIGEFSFVIATLGLSLGVISDFIYPIAVAVSVLCMAASPYLNRSADTAGQRLAPGDATFAAIAGHQLQRLAGKPEAGQRERGHRSDFQAPAMAYRGSMSCWW